MKKAIILLSGGLDSTTCLAIAKASGYACYALSFDYGQKNKAELLAAEKIAINADVIEHKIVKFSAKAFTNSSLTDTELPVKDYSDSSTIPDTYVPARNTVFLAHALSFAEVVQADAIFIGVNDVDYAGYPDCRPAFIEAFQTLARLATFGTKNIVIETPLLRLTKADIIARGIELGVDYSLTVSCYRADKKGKACGNCDSCTYRKKGFAQASIADPTRY